MPRGPVLPSLRQIQGLAQEFGIELPPEEAEVYRSVMDGTIKAYRALSGFRGQSAFYTWLYRIAINSAKNHLVSRARRPAGRSGWARRPGPITDPCCARHAFGSARTASSIAVAAISILSECSRIWRKHVPAISCFSMPVATIPPAFRSMPINGRR